MLSHSLEEGRQTVGQSSTPTQENIDHNMHGTLIGIGKCTSSCQGMFAMVMLDAFESPL